MFHPEREFKKLFRLSKHTRILRGISSLLDWDQETYMPVNSSEIRSEQLKTLAGIIHREKTSKKFSNTLSKLIDIPSGKPLVEAFSESQQAALREWRRDYLHDTSLPASFVEELAKLSSQGIVAWRNARKNKKFNEFSSFLTRIIEMNQRKAEYLGYKEHPYDALLDQYEPDVTTAEVTSLFSTLRKSLIPLLKKVVAAPQINSAPLFGEWDHAKQIAFSHKLLDSLDYDRTKGRLDFSTHPFSSASHPTDSRITTRIHPTSLMSNIMVILHEAGHGIYEMGLPEDAYGSPLGEARSLGVHESQSRWWETRIGLSKPFWDYFYPQLQKIFAGQLDKLSLDAFFKALNRVSPTFIRVEADELTYPFHVILRFELEKELIAGHLKVKDIPEAWNAKMKEYLGIVPANDAEGCLQDIHWSMGAFGYFPTYTLGNLYAAHLFNAFALDHPEWETFVAKGQLGKVKEWLHEKIHRHGRRYKTQELLKRATGKEFSAKPYIQYLEDKYSGIYNL